MAVPVVDIRIVRVGVSLRLVDVGVRVLGLRLHVRVVSVLVVLVVPMRVGMLYPLVSMFVFVPLREVEPHPDTHKCGCTKE